MWQLTVIQKRMASYGETEEKAVFQSKDINELLMLLVRLACYEVRETIYKIERVKGEENESISN